MKFRKRLKRSTKQYIMVALICIIVIGAAAITTSIIMIGQIREEYEFMLNDAKQEMEDNKKTVLLATSNIDSGDILSMDMLEEKVVYSSQPIESYITRKELGKAVLVDIPEGTHIVKGMLGQNLVSSFLREVEYDVIHMGSNISPKDFVDVRIFYPNGESYVVLTKKPLMGFQPDTPICYLWVDEEELLRMSAAIVDAGLYHGSRLYMTKYIEPNIQEPSIITYTPSLSLLSLIEDNPNIVDKCSQELKKEVRKALENRLAASFNMDVKETNWDIEGELRYVPEDESGQVLEDGYAKGIGEDATKNTNDYFGKSKDSDKDFNNMMERDISEEDISEEDIKIPELGKNHKSTDGEQGEVLEDEEQGFFSDDYFIATEG
jgi:hypothetical protein